MARSVNAPSTHHSAVGLLDDCRRSLPPDGREGLGMKSVTFRETQLVAGDVHRHPVPLAEGALEDTQRQRVQQLSLKGALEWARPVYRIIPLTDQEVLGRVTELNGDLAVAEPFQEPPQLAFD